MREAFVGIDVAMANGKRLPVVACVRGEGRLLPLSLNSTRSPRPPKGCGNCGIVAPGVAAGLSEATAAYLRAVEQQFGITIMRIGIDAPSAARPDDVALRRAEAALDANGISYIQTPSLSAFQAMPGRVREHLAAGGEADRVPCANQLWMLFGFELFRVLSRAGWSCLEVYPQATVRALGVGGKHKSERGAVLEQLTEAAKHTGWPAEPHLADLKSIAFGSAHDRLDAYLAAWVASLDESERTALGQPPDDVIWIPKLEARAA